MTERSWTALPWTLLAASTVLVLTLLYLLFMAYLPAQRRVSGLEAELRGVYAREAELQSRLQQELRDGQIREQQLASFAAERQALTRRVEELETALALRRGRR